MICPQCKAEYRQGFTVCADCEVPLVESTVLARAHGSAEDEPAATPGDPEKDPFCSFWKGTDLRVCTEICTVLDEVGIPHKTIRRQDHLFNLSNQSPYEVGVPASRYEKAELAIRDAFGTDEETGEDAVPLLPPPGITRGDSQDTTREARDREREASEVAADANEWLGARYPEDATSEVWSGEDLGLQEMIEMSLHENDLMSRTEKELGVARVLVLPEDKARAKEIVREIVEGTPLE